MTIIFYHQMEKTVSFL